MAKPCSTVHPARENLRQLAFASLRKSLLYPVDRYADFAGQQEWTIGIDSVQFHRRHRMGQGAHGVDMCISSARISLHRTT